MSRFDYVADLARVRGWALPSVVYSVSGVCDEHGRVTWLVNGKRMP